MKIYEHFGFSMVTAKSPITATCGDISYLIDLSWTPMIEAPDGHVYKLDKPDWNAADLVDFIKRYPLERENECTFMLHSNDYDPVTLVVDSYVVYFEEGAYEIEFNAL